MNTPGRSRLVGWGPYDRDCEGSNRTLGVVSDRGRCSHRATRRRCRDRTRASVPRLRPRTPAIDDEQARRARLLRFGKGAVLAHRSTIGSLWVGRQGGLPPTGALVCAKPALWLEARVRRPERQGNRIWARGGWSPSAGNGLVCRTDPAPGRDHPQAGRPRDRLPIGAVSIRVPSAKAKWVGRDSTHTSRVAQP